MDQDNITTIIVSVVSSGVLAQALNWFANRNKNRVDATAKLQKSALELTERYEKEALDARKRVDDLEQQGSEARSHIAELEAAIGEMRVSFQAKIDRLEAENKNLQTKFMLVMDGNRILTNQVTALGHTPAWKYANENYE